MNVLIIGASGAIGGVCVAVCKELPWVTNVFTPTSSELMLGDLNSSIYFDRLPSIHTVILAFGTYGGLKSYESNLIRFDDDNIATDLEKILHHPSCEFARVIMYSSAVLEHLDNLLPSSPYYKYSSQKRIFETVLRENSSNFVIFRPTNIISRYENYQRSGHSVASIFRNIRNQKKSQICEIWSHPLDWREFTTESLLSHALRKVMSRDIQPIASTFAFGSGEKFLMRDLVFEIAKILDYDFARIKFTQPRKSGPLPDLISRQNQLFENQFVVNVVDELKEVIKVWLGADSK